MDSKMSTKAIGVFDSGIGGLTVAKEIIKILPGEDIIYLGDTARVPYGTRGKEVITKFALELTKFLLAKNIKILVVACNTISATCLGQIQKISSVPVLGSLTPAVEESIRVTKTNKIGVIGTRATISSHVYEKEIKKLLHKAEVISKNCPLFVPLAEEGLCNSAATKLICHDYLKEFLNTGIDTLILGCTHYPLLYGAIRKAVDVNVQLIDSAKPTAKKLKKILEEKDLLNKKNLKGKLEVYVTDAPERVQTLAEQFLGNHSLRGHKKITLVSL